MFACLRGWSIQLSCCYRCSVTPMTVKFIASDFRIKQLNIQQSSSTNHKEGFQKVKSADIV